MDLAEDVLSIDATFGPDRESILARGRFAGRAVAKGGSLSALSVDFGTYSPNLGTLCIRVIFLT
jgi:hypothetical protein